MAKRQVTFSFPEELLGEPIIYTIGQQFRVTTNIRQAEISEIKGWVKLELEGEEGDIDEFIRLPRLRPPFTEGLSIRGY